MDTTNRRNKTIFTTLIILIILIIISVLGIIFIYKEKDKSSSPSSFKRNIIYDNLFAYSDTLVRKDLYPDDNYQSKKIISLNYINKTMEYGLLVNTNDKDILINIRFNNLEDAFTNIYNNDFTAFSNYNLDEYNTFVSNNTHFKDYTYKYFLKSELNNDKTYFYGLKYDKKCFYSITNQDINNDDINEIKVDESNKDYFDLLAYLFIYGTTSEEI